MTLGAGFHQVETVTGQGARRQPEAHFADSNREAANPAGRHCSHNAAGEIRRLFSCATIEPVALLREPGHGQSSDRRRSHSVLAG